MKDLLQLNFDVNTGWQIEFHQRINCFVSGVNDIHQTQVGTNLKLISRRFVNVRGAQDIKALDPSRKRHRTANNGACPLCGFDDFLS